MRCYDIITFVFQKTTISPSLEAILVFDCCSVVSVNVCFLKNIILAGNLKYMGYKIKFHALLFRFGPTGISENNTISKEWQYVFL